MTRQLHLLLWVVAGMHLPSPNSCAAQESVVTAGDRIRVKPLTRPKGRVTGSVVSVRDDLLIFEARGDIRRLKWADIDKLEITTGEKSHLGGTIAGGLIGAFAGAALGATLERLTAENCSDFCGLGGGFFGLVFGGVAGSFSGYYLLPHERWTEVPLDGFRVGIGPGTLQLRFGL